jgi:hypothetical protein
MLKVVLAQMFVALISITLVCIAGSLWVRRRTWFSRWEVAGTLCIAAQGCAALLISPTASAILGPPLHAISGMWNLEDFLGHVSYVVAAVALAQTVLSRITDDDRLQEIGTQWIERPATVCIPLMLAAWALGNGSKIYRSNFYEVPGDAWLKIYWLLFSIMLIYLLAWTLRGVLFLRRIPRHRPTATVYLVLVVAGIAVCTARIVTEWCSWPEHGVVGWLSTFAGGIIFAVAAARSWRTKTRWFERRPDPDSPRSAPQGAS